MADVIYFDISVLYFDMHSKFSERFKRIIIMKNYENIMRQQRADVSTRNHRYILK